MQLLQSLLFAPLLASALSFGSSGSQAHALDEQYPVPGESPLFFCENPENYLATVENVVLSPNPPVPGQKLTITGNGTFHEQIDEGATVFLQVKYGLITLIKQTADMCEQLPKIDMECPIKKGYMEIYKEVDIPKQVPPGRYTVLADVRTNDDRPVTCMNAQVAFSRA